MQHARRAGGLSPACPLLGAMDVAHVAESTGERELLRGNRHSRESGNPASCITLGLMDSRFRGNDDLETWMTKTLFRDGVAVLKQAALGQATRATPNRGRRRWGTS